MASATRPLPDDDSFQPRLFFLDHSAIVRIKGRMPQYQEIWHQMDGKTKSYFTLEDASALKDLIRTFYDETKLLFVYRPFNDLRAHHGYLLISDPTVLEKVRLKKLTTQTYNFKIWPNCVIQMTEEKLASSMGSRYFIGAVRLLELLKSVAPNNQILRWTSNKFDREATLRQIYYSVPQQLTPLPELFCESGWNFEHFGFCSTLELFDPNPGTQIPADPKIRKLNINLSTGSSVVLYRHVDLNFFDQFRQTFPAFSMQLPFPSPSPRNVTAPKAKFQKIGKKSNPNLIPILGPRKKLSDLASPQNLLISQTDESWEIYSTTPKPRKINFGPFTMTTQLLMTPMLSPSLENDNRAVYSPIQTAAEDPCPRFSPQLHFPSTSVLAQPEDATHLLNLKLSKKKLNKLSFGKKMKLSSQRFSISFIVGGETMSVGHKVFKSISVKFAQKILRVLENGYPMAKDKKKKKSKVTQTENREFAQQCDPNQLYGMNQTYSRATTSQQCGIEEMQLKKVITLAQYKNKLNSNWTDESQVQESKIAPDVTQNTLNTEKAPEIQEKSISAENPLMISSNQILATPRKPKIVRKILTPKQFQLQKESQAIINQTLAQGLGLKPPEFFQNAQKKNEEQVWENKNVAGPEEYLKSPKHNKEKDVRDVNNDLAEIVFPDPKKYDKDDDDLGIVRSTNDTDEAVEPGPTTLKLRLRKAKSKIENKSTSKSEQLTKQAIKRSRKRKTDNGEVPSDSKKILKRLQPSKRFEPGISFKKETRRMLQIKLEVKQEPMEDEPSHENYEIEPSIFIKEELDLEPFADASESF